VGGVVSEWSIVPGDALLVLPRIEDETFDAVITDPPYSSGGQFRSDRSNATGRKYQHSDTEAEYPDFDGDSRDQRGFLAWSTLWLAECWRVAKRGGVVAAFIDWRMLPTMTDAIQAGGWIWRGVGVWHKVNARPCMGRFRAECEFVVWGSKGAMPTDRGVPVLPGHWSCPPVPTADREHLTEKPVEVMREVVRLCVPGGHVLDPFFGSGSTGVACLTEGMSVTGVELSAEYEAIARRRMQDHEAGAPRGSSANGQGALFGKTG
jgi:site-specific DNA-methyltransferase (adenine-specific)